MLRNVLNAANATFKNMMLIGAPSSGLNKSPQVVRYILSVWQHTITKKDFDDIKKKKKRFQTRRARNGISNIWKTTYQRTDKAVAHS